MFGRPPQPAFDLMCFLLRHGCWIACTGLQLPTLRAVSSLCASLVFARGQRRGTSLEEWEEAALPLDRVSNPAVNRPGLPEKPASKIVETPDARKTSSRRISRLRADAEERRFAVRGHYYEYPGMDGERGEIWCYTDRFSYRPGEVAYFFVSASAKSFAIRIVRDGATETPVFEQHGIDCRWQDTPDQCSVEGCGWEASFEIAIGDDWPSGAYRVTLIAEGRDGAEIASHHLFIVSPKPGKKPGRVLQVAATGTWLSYNTWGGSNAYEGITGHGRNQYARSGLDAAALVPRLRRAAARRAARAAGNLHAAEDRAALSAHGMGAGDRTFQEIRLGWLGELRQPFLPLGRACRLCRRPGQPARSAFFA